jgi:methionine-gamma-lyase
MGEPIREEVNMGKKELRFATIAVHGRKHLEKHKIEEHIRSVSPPIYQSSTFAFESAEQGARIFAGEEEGYIYTRLGNPTIRALELEMANLEKGEDAAALGSGMAATATGILALTRTGEEVVSSNTLYGGTHSLFIDTFPRLGIKVTEVDGTKPKNIENAMTDKTKVVFIETPANPTLALIDISKTAEIAHKHGAVLMVDNTFCTPYYQRPLEFGADIVIHSATKYIGGHGDTVAGILVGSKNYIHGLKNEFMRDLGGVISPFNAWLLLRGLKTLPVRMNQHSDNAMKIARFLADHPKVANTHYPGLETHLQYDLGCRQMSGFGGIIAFDLKGGKEAGRILMNNVNLWTLAVSLGDVDSLIQHPASMTHSTYTPGQLKEAHISEGLVRLSVGLEDANDLIEDLNEALKLIPD